MINPKLYLIGGALFVVVFLTWHYIHTVNENKRLVSEITRANNAITQLDSAIKQRDEIAKNERERDEQIDSAPESDDGPTAPVLLRTARQLR